MSNPLLRELTQEERKLGAVAFYLLLDWKRWVHRRVESVSFLDPITYSRHVSVDFSWPAAAAIAGPTKPHVPLALLKKRNLRRFSLRDETGRALPLLSWYQTAPIASAILHTAARWVPLGGASSWGPAGIDERTAQALWAIAHEEPPEALAALDSICVDRSDFDPEFLSLARDLALNFLVLVPMDIAPGDRRIVKFSYEEQYSPTRRPDKRFGRVPAFRLSRPGAVGDQGEGALTVHSLVSDLPSPGHDVPGLKPAAGLTYEVRSLERGFCRRLSTRADGSAACRLPAGEYQLEELPPRYLLPRTDRRLRAPVTRLTIRAGGAIDRSFRYTRTQHPPAAWRRRVTDTTLLALRLLGWYPFTIRAGVPAAGHCASYHLEVMSPEGLQITAAELTEEPVLPLGDADLMAPDTFEVQHAEERGAMHRSHLYVTDFRPSSRGVAKIKFRSRPGTLAGPASLSALFTSALLGATASRAATIGSNAGAVAALLLFLPGALSAYVARPRENALETRVLLSLRVLVIVGAAASVVGAVVLSLNRDWIITSNQLSPTKAWGGTTPTLWGCFAVAVASAVLLSIAWWRSARPPESRPPHAVR